MDLVLKGLRYSTLLVYLDDIIIMGSSFQEHLERLDEVFTRLGKTGLKLQAKKCELFQGEVPFLGHVVSADGLRPDPTKVSAITEWGIPRNQTDVRSFLGLCSYYRRFIPQFSTRAHPLNRLLEAGQPFRWTDECQQALDDLKGALTSDSLVAYPEDDGLFILDTDASSVGIGATLSQIQWNERAQQMVECPVFYASCSLNKSQRRYCVTRRELLAVVFFVTKFKHYLFGRQFVVRTDHSALRWLMSFKEPCDQMARWLEALSQFNFSIVHRKGKQHGNADGLSRAPCDPEACPCYDGQTVLEDLPCGGCNQCIKKHQQWSCFWDTDDVVPLVAKCVGSSTQLERPSDSVKAGFQPLKRGSSAKGTGSWML